MDDSLDPCMRCLMADDSLAHRQGGLTYEPQDVVHQRAICHNQFARGRLSRQQPLKVHVGLDLCVVQLRQAVPLVQFDDLLIVKLQTSSPPFFFNIRGEQGLPFVVFGTLSNPHHPTEVEGLLCVSFIGNRFFLLP